jgi:hypothetical protein
MSDDLVQWLRDRLDEDERIAREAAGNYESGGRWWEDGRFGSDGVVADERGSVVVYRTGVGRQHAAHIALHDPARVLREIDTKRRILDTLVEEGGDRMFADIFRLLALPYADQPGYREEWQPS